jgi:hypothetical protein
MCEKNWPYLAAKCWHDILLSPLGFTELHHHLHVTFLNTSLLKPISLRPENAPFCNPFRTVSLSFELFYALHFLQLSFVYFQKFSLLPKIRVYANCSFKNISSFREHLKFYRENWKSLNRCAPNFFYNINICSVSFPSFWSHELFWKSFRKVSIFCQYMTTFRYCTKVIYEPSVSHD